MDLSFIIPAYNEELSIGGSIESIYAFVPDRYAFEIIVVNNDSTDHTAEVARAKNAIVIDSDASTIAQLRNIGAKAASGNLLVFVDADVELTVDWKSNISSVIKAMQMERYQCIAGSHCVPMLNDHSYLSQCWFVNIAKNIHSSSIGSAHMIMNKCYFEEIGCFDEKLNTGEDHEICLRVKKLSGKLLIYEELKVVHKGYPSTIKEFFKREVWHGVGDCHSIKSFLSSKVAVISQVLLLLSIGAIVALLMGEWGCSLAILAVILLILVVVILIKLGKQSATCLLYNIFVSYIYFVARAISLYISKSAIKGWK